MIYGSYIYDLSSLAKAFDLIGYSYKLVGKNVGEYKEVKNEKPTDIIIVEGVEKAKRSYADTIIVVDSKPMLSRTNVDQSLFQLLPERSLLAQLKKIINKPHIELEIKTDSLQEVVEKITTKSILTDIQTLVNKVNPYDLRKKVHKVVISYLYGSSFKELSHFLESSVKLLPLLEICKKPQMKAIRKAVAEYKKTKDEESAAKTFGVHTFEILYVFNSFKKLEAENDNK